MADQGSEMEKISRRLHSIELRLSRLESAFTITDKENLYRSEEQVQTVNPSLNSVTLNEEDKGLESQIGRFGLAWLGNIVLLFGIVILTQYLMNLGHRFSSILFGYIIAASIFFLANYLKKTNDHLSFIFKINAVILLYYITLRLHFFSTSPVL